MSEPTTDDSASLPLRWGIVSTGHIAGVFARNLPGSKTGKVVAVGSRSTESAATFAEEHGVAAAHTHGSLEGLLADADVDAIYVATPHPMHCEAVVAGLEAGKHVLCEKPLAMSVAEVDRMQDAARASGRTFMEAWMYRCHPQTDRLMELVAGGAIGELRHVQAAFSFKAPYDPAGRLWNLALGGGGILDVGGYPLSYARRLAGVAAGEPFLDPEALHGVGVIHPESGADTQATAALRFGSGVTAEVSCGTLVQQDNVVRVYGTEGWIHVPSPFVVTRDVSPTSLWLHREGEAEPEEIVITPDRGLYAYEADAFAAAVAAGRQEVDACTWADTRGNIAAQFEWCRQVGVKYA